MKRRRLLLAALAGAIVALAIALAVRPPATPEPLPADAAAERFSAGRAMAALEHVAVAPRPLGSPEAARQRMFLLGQLRGLGLPAQVVSGVVVAEDGRTAGTVHDVVARLPGRDSTRAILLVAHYDSVAVADGAADDGSGVVTLLETARALSVSPRLRNDVIFLFADGEEKGLLGARAFLRYSPLAYGVGPVLNFDSPGSSSPVLMYETSTANGRLVREYAAAVDAPFASSLMYEVSRRLPPRSDFRPFVEQGFPGMAFAALDGPAYNHTGYDDLARFDLTSLQHQGDTALAVTRRLGGLDLWDLRAPDVVYFNVIDRMHVVYDARRSLPFALLAAAAYVGALFVGLRRRLLRPAGIARGLAASAAVLGTTLVLLGLTWWMYVTAYEERHWTDTGVVLSDSYRIGLVLLAAALVTGLYGALLRALSPWDLAAATLFWWLVATLSLAVAVPGASYLMTWPLLVSALGLSGALAYGERALETVRGVLLATLPAVAGIVLLGSATWLLLMSAGLKQLITVTAVWFAGGLLVLPIAVVRRATGQWLSFGLAVVGLVVLMAVGSTVAYNATHPHFNSLYYRQAATGTALWETLDRRDGWIEEAIGTEPSFGMTTSYFAGMGSEYMASAPAPALGLEGPRAEVLEDEVTGGTRSVRLRVWSPRGAAAVSVLVESVVGPLSASVQGLPLRPGDTTILDRSPVRWRFDYYAPPAEGFTLSLRFAAGPALKLRLIDATYGVPATLAGSLPPRPEGVLPGRAGDGTLVESTLELPAVGEAPGG